MQYTPIKQSDAEKLDAVIAAAAHCKARRADPNDSYEGVELFKAIAALTECEDVLEAAEEIEHQLELQGQVAA